MRSLRLKEASLTRTNAEVSHRSQQLDTRLNILEAELSKLKEEVWKCVQELLRCHRCYGVLDIIIIIIIFVLQAKNCQKLNHRLQEELATSQQECDRLQGELQHILLQLDTHIR